ncbi:MAG: DUF4136 domain-containing protein [Melioribacteraceae bacterium]|nr:DUF4136 domain-containing protein [Melioribacteraceae bacterium]
MRLNSKINRIGIIPILFLLLTLTSCYSDYGLSSADHDVIITQYEKSTDFSKYKTYAIVDSVYHITGDTTKPDSEYLGRKHDAFILKTVADNMNALGYTQVLNPTDASQIDVVIYVAAQGTKVDQYYYGGGWGGGYYPGWGWGGGYYPGWGYPGYVGKATYYVGTLFINYVDVDNIDNATIDVEWYAILNGLLNNDSYAVSQNRLEDRINKAFEQSPYLQVSN